MKSLDISMFTIVKRARAVNQMIYILVNYQLPAFTDGLGSTYAANPHSSTTSPSKAVFIAMMARPDAAINPNNIHLIGPPAISIGFSIWSQTSGSVVA